MKSLRKIILVALVTVVGAAYYAPAKAKSPVAAFGSCYTLYQCQGVSIGVFSDIQCRSMGGHSIDSAGVCFNL